MTKKASGKKPAKAKAKPKRGRGRPSDYKPEYAEQAYKLTAFFGATDADLAKYFSKNVDTIYEWKKKHPEFSDALKKGKFEIDMLVVQRLYERATGYTHEEDKIFQYEGKPVIVPTTKHYPPDPTAAIFWLKNRQPDKWREKQEAPPPPPAPDVLEDYPPLRPDEDAPNRPIL